MRLLLLTLSGTTMPLTRVITRSLILLGGLSYGALAQQPDNAPTWGIGVAVVSSQQAYTGIDRDNKVLPLLSYENRYVRIIGPEVAVKLPSYQLNESNSFKFNVIGKYDFTDYEQNDAPILNGMEDRDGGFWVGFRTEWQNPLAEISVELATEVAGDSDGSSANISLEKTWHFAGNYMFTPRIGVNWQNKDYIDYYYGVRANEVSAERAFYQGEAGTSVEFGARVAHLFNYRHFIFLDMSVTSLATEIKDSPLVDRSSENRLLFAYIYNF